MGTFIKLVNLEVGSIEPKDFYEPDEDLHPYDEKVGVMGEGLMPLYTYWLINETAAEEKVIKAKYFIGSKTERKKLRDEAIEFRARAHILRAAFWLEVRQDIKIWDKTKLGVRKGRLIVTLKPEYSWMWKKPGPDEILY